MSKVEEIFSVGIDIGTTTSSVVISKLKIKNVASGFVVPKIEIVEKHIIYRSDVFFTPLLDEVTIDFDGIEVMVREEYKKARVNIEEIKTGAVIITGDTARKENAESVLQAVSRMAGSFVVATAGPHLEAFIAGLGSGAGAFSGNHHTTASNVDIGGGTTNISIFDDGRLVSTLCADIGGRLISFEPRTTRVKGFIRGGEVAAQHVGIKLKRGEQLHPEDLFKIGDALAEALCSIVEGKPDALAEKLALGEYTRGITSEHVMLSGGVGRLFYGDENPRDVKSLTRFGDIGPVLALSLKKASNDKPWQMKKPDETIYATVIGAGVHTTELSGSTIYISNPDVLPLRDIPAIRLTVTEDSQQVNREIINKAEKFIVGDSDALPAIVVPEAFGNSFNKIKTLATAITRAAAEVMPEGPLIVICEDDIGKAMGNLLKNSLSHDRPVISIDQITMKEGDYIDIGKPLYDGGVVPVVIKTLVFSNN